MTVFSKQDVADFKVQNVNSRGFFSGYASVFNITDDQNDVVQSGAFRLSLENFERKLRLPKMLWQHDPFEPIGRWIHMEEDADGLYVEGQLVMEIERARDAYALMQAKAIDGLSIGYHVKDSFKGSLSPIRYITQLELFEVSLVTFAANPKARIIKVKGTNGESRISACL